MATKKIDKIRGSIDIPLDANGIKQAKAAGGLFKKHGGVEVIAASKLRRAARTGARINEDSPGSAFFLTPDLEPWHLGDFEGQDTDKVLPLIMKYANETPGKKVPGKSPQSTAPGESFDDFRERFLKYFNKIRKILKEFPDKKVVIVTHYRCVKLIQAYARKDAPANLEVHMPHMSSQPKAEEQPGSIFYWNDKPGHYSLDPVKTPTKAGLYVVRHGETSYNGGPS